jgi:hypothetical protein
VSGEPILGVNIRSDAAAPRAGVISPRVSRLAVKIKSRINGLGNRIGGIAAVSGYELPLAALLEDFQTLKIATRFPCLLPCSHASHAKSV